MIKAAKHVFVFAVCHFHCTKNIIKILIENYFRKPTMICSVSYKISYFLTHILMIKDILENHPKTFPSSVQEEAVQDFCSSQQNSLRLRKSVWNEATDLQLMRSETKHMKTWDQRSTGHRINQRYDQKLCEEQRIRVSGSRWELNDHCFIYRKKGITKSI